MVDERDIEELIDGRPDLADGLDAILSVDDETTEWTFDDVPVETGEFGEIVAHDIVEDTGNGYRVRSPGLVRNVLEGTEEPPESGNVPVSERLGKLRSGLSGQIGYQSVIVFGLAVLFVATRVIPYTQVFRGEDVVLSGNDPYHYQYWVDRMLTEASSPTSVSGFSDSIQVAGEKGEPLFVTTVWAVSIALGGTSESAATVLAWYPVVSALCLGALVYAVGAYVLEDKRVGLLAAGLLAIMPAHAMRTSVGFGDHHAFDYVWLLATIAVLACIVTVDDETFKRTNLRASLGLGIAITGLIMSWNGSPLMLFPVAGYLAIKVPLDVFADRSPLPANGPVLLGLLIAAVLSLGIHLVFGWQSLIIAAVPSVLAAGGVSLAGISGVLDRRGITERQLVAMELSVAVIGLAAFSLAVEGAFGALASGVGFVLGKGGISETGSALSRSNYGGVKLFGVTVIFALPVLIRGAWRALNGDDRWLVLSVFGWYFLVLSALQLRFAGQFSPLVALFAGTGVLWYLARLGLVPTPAAFSQPTVESAPDTKNAQNEQPASSLRGQLDWNAANIRSGFAAMVLVVALVGTSGLFLPEKVTGMAVEERNYETTSFMVEYSDERGWEYPENYVFSRWGYNRMFNYPVNGVSNNYSFAQENYSTFVASNTPEQWYEEWHDRIGFIVIEPIPQRPRTIQQHFYETYGSKWDNYDAVSHYRAVFTDESQRNKVFVLVPGATVVGPAPSNASVELRTTVEIPNDSFLYRQQPAVNSSGYYTAVVPYPGTYEVRVNNRTDTVYVPERAVENNASIYVGE